MKCIGLAHCLLSLTLLETPPNLGAVVQDELSKTVAAWSWTSMKQSLAPGELSNTPDRIQRIFQDSSDLELWAGASLFETLRVPRLAQMIVTVPVENEFASPSAVIRCSEFTLTSHLFTHRALAEWWQIEQAIEVDKVVSALVIAGMAQEMAVKRVIEEINKLKALEDEDLMRRYLEFDESTLRAADENELVRHAVMYALRRASMNCEPSAKARTFGRDSDVVYVVPIAAANAPGGAASEYWIMGFIKGNKGFWEARLMLHAEFADSDEVAHLVRHMMVGGRQKTKDDDRQRR